MAAELCISGYWRDELAEYGMMADSMVGAEEDEKSLWELVLGQRVI